MEELPGELEGLYTEMWKRSNADTSVYRETAGRYFRYVTSNLGEPKFTVEIPELSSSWTAWGVKLLDVALAEAYQGIDVRGSLQSNIDNTPADLKGLCEVMQDNIDTRCAGILQVQPAHVDEESWYALPDELQLGLSKVEFIHRTACDFLVETEAGRRILNYNFEGQSLADEAVMLMRCLIDIARALQSYGFSVDVHDAIDALITVSYEDEDQKLVRNITQVLRDFFEEGILSDIGSEGPIPRRFISRLARASPDLDDLVMSLLEEERAEASATDVFRDLIITTSATTQSFMINAACALPIIPRLILSGADPHVRDMPPFNWWSSQCPFDDGYMQQVSAFEVVLLHRVAEPSEELSPPLVELICAMAQMRPNWDSRLLLEKSLLKSPSPMDLAPLIEFACCDFRCGIWSKELGWRLFCEVNLQFLLERFLDTVDGGNSKLQELANTATAPVARVRCINWHTTEYEPPSSYRVLKQEPFQDVIRTMMGPNFTFEAINDIASDATAVSEVDFDSELESLAQEGLGFLKLQVSDLEEAEELSLFSLTDSDRSD